VAGVESGLRKPHQVETERTRETHYVAESRLLYAPGLNLRDQRVADAGSFLKIAERPALQLACKRQPFAETELGHAGRLAHDTSPHLSFAERDRQDRSGCSCR